MSALFVIAAWSGSRAQIPAEPDPEAGFEVGPTTLFPLVLIGYQHTNNVFYRPAHPTDANGQPQPSQVEPATIANLEAGLAMMIPVSNSKVSLAAARLWRDYSNAPTADFWYGRAVADLVFGNGTTLTFGDAYESGVVEAQSFRVGAGEIPGGEIVFTGQPYHSNDANAEVGIDLGVRHGVAVRYDYQTVDFTGSDDFGFYDLAANSFEVHGFERVADGAQVVWSATGLWNDLSRPQTPDFPTDSTSQQRGLSAEAGYRRELGASGGLIVRAGGIRVDVTSDTPFTYTGVIGSVEYERNVPDRFFAAVGYYRNVYPSPFSSSDLFVGGTALVRVATPYSQRFLAGGEVSLSRNDYPNGADARVDKLLLTRAWIGYRIGKALKWRVFATGSWRNSTNANLDFSVLQYGTTLGWGL